VVAEPTVLEAILRLKKEVAGMSLLIGSIVGAGSWLGLGEMQKSDDSAGAVAAYYVPALAASEARNADQRKVCLELLENERKNTDHWRDQCR